MSKSLKVILVAALSLAFVASASMAKTGKKAWLGVYTQGVNEEIAEAFDLSVDQGAIVNSVVADSPADEAGIREDDIIIAIGNSRVTDADDLVDIIAESDAGETISITVIRGGKEKRLEAVLDKYRDATAYLAKPAPRSRSFSYYFSDDDHSYIGVELLDISNPLAKHLGNQDGGTLINEVVEDSPADKAGLKPGDLIIGVDGKEVTSARELSSLIRDLDEGETTRLEIIRDGKPKSVEVEVASNPRGFYSSGPGVFTIPDLPRLKAYGPKLKGLHNLDFNFDDLDLDDYEDELKELKKDLRELRKEFRELRDSR